MCSSTLSPNYRFHIAKVIISIFSTNNFLFFLSFLFHFLWLWIIFASVSYHARSCGFEDVLKNMSWKEKQFLHKE